jgi:hypothetical protein
MWKKLMEEGQALQVSLKDRDVTDADRLMAATVVHQMDSLQETKIREGKAVHVGKKMHGWLSSLSASV